MEPDTRVSKKIKQIVHEDDDGADNSPPSPDWLSLPDDLLSKLFHHLFIPDLFAFSSVCSKLRSFTPRSNCLLGPPLLFCSIPNAPRNYGLPIRSSMRCIKALTPYPRPLHSMISPRTLNTYLYGNSYGHLIFFTRVAIIANIFSGKEIRSPKIPYCKNYLTYSLATLTSNPSNSSSCYLVCAKWNTYVKGTDIFSWKVGTDDDWSYCTLMGDVDPKLCTAADCPQSMLFFQGKLVLLSANCRVYVLQFVPVLS